MTNNNCRPFKLTVASTAIAAVVLITGWAQAAPITSTATDPSQTAFSSDVSNSDLLHGIVGTHIEYNSFPGTRTNDGLHGGDTDTGGIAWAKDGNITSSTFVIPTANLGQSWKITSITSIAAWNSAGFMNQKYDVSVRPLGASTFVPLASVDYQPFGGAGGPGSTKVVINDDTGTLSSGVEAIRFSIRDTDSVNNGGVTLRELDVFGSVQGPPPGFVINASFEEPNIANNSFSAGSFFGWTAVGTAGVQDFGAQSPGATDGQQHAFANASAPFGGPSTLHQTLGDVISNGETYTLTVDVGQITNFSDSEATIRLFGDVLGPDVALSNANGTAELTGISPLSGGPYLFDQMVTYTALPFGDPFAGQQIGIALVGASGTQVLFDNVRFAVTPAPVPEPSSIAIWSLIGLCSVGYRYFRMRII